MKSLSQLKNFVAQKVAQSQIRLNFYDLLGRENYVTWRIFVKISVSYEVFYMHSIKGVKGFFLHVLINGGRIENLF